MDTYFLMLVYSLILMTLYNNEVHAQSEQSFNLLDFGAVGDGNIDDSQALTKAWEAVCVANSPKNTLLVPNGKTFLVKPLKLQGPCNSPNINIVILGKIIGPKSLSDYPTPTPDSWLEISKVDGLYVSGDGIIDGRGQVWWKTCRGNDCPRRPATAAFINCNNLTLRGLTFVNSSRNHISIRSCNNVIISRLIIQAPGDSVNTDGIDIAFSSFVAINQCYIATGDDCVAITNESHDINITKVHCGPGHGISIGSLGKGGGNDTIQNVHVWNCTFKGTTNGARIKTWQGGLGFARNIIYEDLLFENASNPIIIDQFYCPGQQCKNQTNAVKINDVAFRRVSGTSQSKNAIILHCSQNFGCSVQIEGANIISSKPGEQTSADCFNAHIQNSDSSNNVPSLKDCH